jgi:ABC-type sugar transport system substrate-binding protein
LIESEMQAEQRRSNRRGQITDQLETWKNRGWIEKFAAAENPVREYEWAGQFVQMIREAAWELGYLKTNSVTDSTDDSDEFSDVDDLIEGMRV